MTKGYHGSKTNEAIRDLWRTPKRIFNYYNHRFNFELDLAASSSNALCEHFITMEENALDCDVVLHKMLSSDIYGAIWCNPPYSDVTPWVETAIFHKEHTEAVVVLLLPADTSVKWFKLAFDNCSECHLISGRLAFINEETGKPVSGNNKGSVVFIFDPKSPFKSQVCLIERDEIMGQKKSHQ